MGRTKAELIEENEQLRARLEEIHQSIEDALGFEDEEDEEDEEDDDNDD